MAVRDIIFNGTGRFDSNNSMQANVECRQARPGRDVIAFVDKGDPPQHSFVDGMLCDAYRRKFKHDRVYLFVSGRGRPRRHGNAILIPVLFRRRLFGRFANIIQSAVLTRTMVARSRSKARCAALFVRNDPASLLGVSIAAKGKCRVTFQNSFPFEIGEGRWSIKASIAVMLYKICSSSVDGVVVVSPLAKKRVARYFQNAKFAVVPLAFGFQSIPKNVQGPQSGKRAFRAVYIGTHHRDRDMSFVLSAIADGLAEVCDSFEIHTYGGTPEQLQELANDRRVATLLKSGRLKLQGRVSREQVPTMISDADLGICIVPPTNTYVESFPTKLLEYLGCGVPAIANREIPAHVEVIETSRAGIMCDYSARSIRCAIIKAVGNGSTLTQMAMNGVEYVSEFATYKAYVDALSDVVHGS